jgi:hypothetical protein
MFTESDAKTWVESNKTKLIDSLLRDPEIPSIFKQPNTLFEDIFCAGAWLDEKLREHGATAAQVQDICTAVGQRSFSGDPYKLAVQYLNEFSQSGGVKDKAGWVLAEQIINGE